MQSSIAWNQFATTQAPPTDIFDAAMLTGNVIRDRESLFLSRLIALTGTSLVVDQSQEPLTTAWRHGVGRQHSHWRSAGRLAANVRGHAEGSLPRGGKRAVRRHN